MKKICGKIVAQHTSGEVDTLTTAGRPPIPEPGTSLHRVRFLQWLNEFEVHSLIGLLWVPIPYPMLDTHVKGGFPCPAYYSGTWTRCVCAQIPRPGPSASAPWSHQAYKRKSLAFCSAMAATSDAVGHCSQGALSKPPYNALCFCSTTPAPRFGSTARAVK